MGNVVADRFGAKRAPEAFILDEGRAIRYRGRIDDQYGVGSQRQTPTSRDLIEALEELLAGKPVSRPVTRGRRLPDQPGGTAQARVALPTRKTSPPSCSSTARSATAPARSLPSR